MLRTRAKYHLGQVVRHKKHPFRGVVFDVDPQFTNMSSLGPGLWLKRPKARGTSIRKPVVENICVVR